MYYVLFLCLVHKCLLCIIVVSYNVRKLNVHKIPKHTQNKTVLTAV